MGGLVCSTYEHALLAPSERDSATEAVTLRRLRSTLLQPLGNVQDLKRDALDLALPEITPHALHCL